VIKKIFKYVLFLLLFLLTAVIGVYFYAVNTQHGSRLTLDMIIKYSGVDLTVGGVTGTLANGLELNGIDYQDDTVNLSAQHVAYQNQWSIFNRQIDFSSLQLDDVVLTLKETQQPVTEAEPFNGFEWPLSIKVEQLTVNQLTIIHPQWRQYFDQLKLSASASDHLVDIRDFNVLSETIQLQTTGSLKTLDSLKYTFEPNIKLQKDGSQLNLSGSLSGDLNELNLKKNISIDDSLLKGNVSANGVVYLTANPELDLTFNSEQMHLFVSEQDINLSQLKASLSGHLESYQLELNSIVKNEQYPAVDISMLALGDLNSLNTESAKIITDDGMLDLNAELNWQDTFMLKSEIVAKDFNPGLFFKDWAGNINGNVNLGLTNKQEGLVISSKNNDLKGTLKNNYFELKGSVEYSADTLTADEMQLIMGPNQVITNGSITDDQISMTLNVELPEIQILKANWRGQLNGTLNLSGNHQNPEIKGNFTGNQLAIEDIEVGALKLDTQGVWEQQLSTNIVADQLNIAQKSIESLSVNQTGWLDDHHLSITAKHDDVEQTMELTGQYEQASNHWSGILEKHEVKTASSGSINLIEPVNIKKTDHLTISPACWKGVEQGTLCIELDDINQQYQGTVALNSLSLKPFQLWLPDNLNILGKAEGQISFLIDQNDIDIQSKLSLTEGQLILKKDGQISYQTAIKSFNVNSNSQQANNEVNLEFVTEAGDQINTTTTINQNNSSGWEVNGSINGEIVSIHVIKELTAEINEIEGKLLIDGEISGPLKSPVVQLNFEQPVGFVRFSRFGSLVEGLKISIKTLNKVTPEYLLELSGRNLKDINQGQFKAQGTLLVQQQGWNLEGRLTGENFMIFNMPELKLHVSPDLSFTATEQGASVKGQLQLDEGKVLIEQLPPETVTNSSDLVINQPEKTAPESQYALIFDIKTNIKDRLELKVIGLDAWLSGSIQLTQKANKAMNTVGTLNLEDGKYEVYGQKLDINQGELFFNGSVENPRLNVKASRRSLDDTVTAGVQLGGTVKNLQSNLYSDPALSDIEILSYIMTGEGINNAGSISGEQLKQTAILMGLNQGGPVFKEIQNTFGIDVLTIKEAASKSDTVIEAGKRINDKLYISYNHGIFNRLGFWVLKYKLNEFLNLQTTQGEDQSIELVYTRKARLKSKEKTDTKQEDKDQ
jgi:translocation and assembly module TamB